MEQVLRKVTDLTRKQNVQVFNNFNLGIKVRTIKNEDGSISINAEDTAIGFGWTTVAKSGNEVIRWNRINNYCKELGFSQKIAKDDFIPESLFYLLGMKANNDIARKFQTWLATDVIPQIRKSGYYEIEKPKSTLDLLELQVKALKEVEEKVETVDKKFDELPLFTADAKALKKMVNRVVVPLLGGKKSNAYKPLSKKVFSDLYGQVHREFGVSCCDEIKRKDLELAKEIISNYRIPTALKNQIDLMNSQGKLENL